GDVVDVGGGGGVSGEEHGVDGGDLSGEGGEGVGEGGVGGREVEGEVVGRPVEKRGDGASWDRRAGSEEGDLG
ncbi:hypothetical protein, partial [Micrococcus luteus]|uniref:hypothetical protein n=1 Tax=Micrococcus luteus TaxID=1270 RepID=UPI001C92F063